MNILMAKWSRKLLCGLVELGSVVPYILTSHKYLLLEAQLTKNQPPSSVRDILLPRTFGKDYLNYVKVAFRLHYASSTMEELFIASVD